MNLASSVQSLGSKRQRPWAGVRNPKATGWWLGAKGWNTKSPSATFERSVVRFFLFPIACSLLPVALLSLSACGRKTPVRPPELVAPEPINDLVLEIEKNGVKLRWGRTEKTVDGSELDDLGGFVVLRASQDTQGKTSSFVQLATIPVEDRDRFRKAKKFTYTDEQLMVGTLYRYRVEAFTLDGYYSTPSNTVELIWQGGS